MVDRATITEAALVLLDEAGESGLSMRALAHRLGISAPSLYWHYPSRQDLLEDVADAMVAGVVDSAVLDQSSASDAMGLLVAFRHALLAHRDGARVFAGTFTLGAHVADLTEHGLSALTALGIAETNLVDTWFNLIAFTLGAVIEEQAQHHQPGLHQRRDTFAEMNSHRPYLTAHAERIFEADLEERYLRGITALLCNSRLGPGCGRRGVAATPARAGRERAC